MGDLENRNEIVDLEDLIVVSVLVVVICLKSLWIDPKIKVKRQLQVCFGFSWLAVGIG